MGISSKFKRSGSYLGSEPELEGDNAVVWKKKKNLCYFLSVKNSNRSFGVNVFFQTLVYKG